MVNKCGDACDEKDTIELDGLHAVSDSGRKDEAQQGMLRCVTKKESGYSLLITSMVKIRCQFHITGSGVDGTEHYRGETGNYELAGKCYGGGGSATVGIGGGAQVFQPALPVSI